MTTTMTVHARPEGGVAFGEEFGLYTMIAAVGPISARDLALRTGLPRTQISHWLAGQERGGYVVRDCASGLYGTWSDISSG